ncbi:capsule assembly Wzi family protein [Thalassotalea sediminis]|uniref:capsule assembly Wzi family protein n=1 Tax=Thalassotalea sediminis TaxID=1759089 RepID=UPI002573D742|nr:capsule assembly Wzi family protein [Thalassotalea sediminis]
MKLLLSSFLAIVFFTASVKADPWVDTSNSFLRANIQWLADVGILKTPVTTFPLMWHDIARDLDAIYIGQLDQKTRESVLYVKHQLKLAKRNSKTITASAATDNKRFTSFGEDYRNKYHLNVATNWISDRFAFRVSSHYRPQDPLSDETSFDGSYGALFVGNWVVSAGMQDRWWGPGLDTSLSLTNNAKALPALALSRKSAIPVSIPWTEHEIPWTVTTFMGKMDDERIVKNTLLWGFRFNFNPIKNLEVGITRLAQWSGDGRPGDLSTFVDVLKGLDNCGGNGPTVEECAAGKEPGNQLAGYDIRWSSTLFAHPFALYFTSFAEDGDRKGGLSILGEERYQLGVESQLSAFNYNWKVFIEGTDTYALCRDGVNGDGTSSIGDCYYEHKIYQTGMRYEGRVMGSIYENDATSLVIGASTLSSSNTQIEIKLRWLQLNKDNNDKAPNNPLIGNTLTTKAEDLLQLASKVQHSYKNWRYTFGVEVNHSKFTNENNNNDISAFAKIEYNL